MNALFGPGGNSLAFKEWGGKSTLDAPRFLSEIGLDAYEYEAGNGISSSRESLIRLGEEAKKYKIKTTANGNCSGFFVRILTCKHCPRHRHSSSHHFRKSLSFRALYRCRVPQKAQPFLDTFR